MVQYRRNFLAGGTFFITAVLAARTSRALIEHVEALRAAFRETRAQHPFVIDAVVILPDHIHIVMTLPEGDADYSTRLSLIKRRFTDAVAKLGTQVARRRNGEMALWQRRFWEHTIRDEDISSGTSTTFISTLCDTRWSNACATGRIPRFTAMCRRNCIWRTWPAMWQPRVVLARG